MGNGVLELVRLRQERQTKAEYALILALIAVLCITVLTLHGGAIATGLNRFAASF